MELKIMDRKPHQFPRRPREKMVGKKTNIVQALIALLYLLGRELGTSNKAAEIPDEEEIKAYKEITRMIDKKYKCNDGHIKHNLEKKDDWFLLPERKSGQKQGIRLTPNGKNKAKELAKQLNDELSE